MDFLDGHPDEAVSTIVLDGQEHSVRRHRMPVAEILALVGKSPVEWKLEAELVGGDRATLGGDDEVHLREGGFVRFHTRRRHHHRHHHHGDECELTVVVNSEPVNLDVRRSTHLSAVVAEVLEKAKPTGRPDDQWELKTEAGQVLDQALSLETANVECGATLYLSLKAGAAGDAMTELLVDPEVSRAKFDEEVSDYRRVQDAMIRRGQWLITAEYPEVFVVFGAPNCNYPTWAFGAVLDFTNYDLWPASVKLVNPFTKVPYRAAEMPAPAWLQRVNMSTPVPGQVPTNVVSVDRLMQAQRPEEIPFLCLPGVREYHAHPAHTGDSWLLRRTLGEGKLYRLLDVLFQYGSAPIAGLHVQPAMNLVPQ
jgi:hypothetical protein